MSKKLVSDEELELARNTKPMTDKDRVLERLRLQRLEQDQLDDKTRLTSLMKSRMAKRGVLESLPATDITIIASRASGESYVEAAKRAGLSGTDMVLENTAKEVWEKRTKEFPALIEDQRQIALAALDQYGATVEKTMQRMAEGLDATKVIKIRAKEGKGDELVDCIDFAIRKEVVDQVLEFRGMKQKDGATVTLKFENVLKQAIMISSDSD
jgi:hypothetical protein